MSLRIGLLIKKFDALSNWELRVIQEIAAHSKLQLALLIQKQGDTNQTSKNPSKSSIAGLLLGLQIRIEKRLFFKELQTVDKAAVLNYLKDVQTLKVNSHEKDAIDTLSPQDIQKIKDHKLDVIIKLGFNSIAGDVLNSATHGVWNLLHSDILEKHRGEIGFWEVLQKREGIGVSLLKLSSKQEQEIVIDQAFFNRGWSLVETKRIAQEGAVSLLLKQLEKATVSVNFSEDFKTSNSSTYKTATLFQVVQYLFGFYRHVFEKIVEKVGNTLFGLRQECWSIFIGKGSFLDTANLPAIPVKMPTDEFWADPFLFHHQDTNYVFFENYSYKTKRGKISFGIVNDDEISTVFDVLDFDYHLSFPFIFEEKGSIFLMPETSENKRLEIYKAVDFPTKWELYTTAFEGEAVADAFFYDDDDNQKWLFLNKQANQAAPMNSELFIYRVDSIELNSIEPHTQNPVIIDARVARNGGAIFKHANKRYRPSQRNVEGIYGRALNINRIEKLTIDSYIEETEQIIEPNFDRKLMAMHHVHEANGLFVFDAAYKRK